MSSDPTYEMLINDQINVAKQERVEFASALQAAEQAATAARMGMSKCDVVIERFDSVLKTYAEKNRRFGGVSDEGVAAIADKQTNVNLRHVESDHSARKRTTTRDLVEEFYKTTSGVFVPDDAYRYAEKLDHGTKRATVMNILSKDFKARVLDKIGRQGRYIVRKNGSAYESSIITQLQSIDLSGVSEFEEKTAI